MPDYDVDYDEEPELGHGFVDVELYDREQLVQILGSLIHELTREPAAPPRAIGFAIPPPLPAKKKRPPVKEKHLPSGAPKRTRKR